MCSFLPWQVSVEVKSLCLEEDCTDQSIKVVNPTTGQCVTCFPCLTCLDGVPSVLCGSTVPVGTEIHCVQLPDPALVSRSSAYATSGILTSLVSSPSVTLWSSSLTRTKQISVVPETRNARLVIVPATSSRLPLGSTSSAVYFGSRVTNNHREKPKVHPKEGQKMGENAIIYVMSVVALIVIAIGIVCRLRNRKTIQLQPPTSNTVTHINPTAQRTDTCTVDPAAITAVYSHVHPKDGQDKKGSSSQHSQSNSVYVDSHEEISETIPSSLDVISPEGTFANLCFK